MWVVDEKKKKFEKLYENKLKLKNVNNFRQESLNCSLNGKSKERELKECNHCAFYLFIYLLITIQLQIIF